MTTILFLLALAPFYFIGAFPTGMLLARANGIDLTHQGSGNVGATNVSRTMGKKLGALTLFVDIFKGYIAAYLALLISGSLTFAIWAGVISILGHCFSIPNILKGGKGVATSFGVLLFLQVQTALVTALLFGLIFILTKTVSIASLVATASSPAIAVFFGVDDALALPLVMIAAVVCFRHRDNLNRIMRGEESRFK